MQQNITKSTYVGKRVLFFFWFLKYKCLHWHITMIDLDYFYYQAHVM